MNEPVAQPLDLLIVEDRADDAELVAHELRRFGFDLTWRRVDRYRDLDAALDAASAPVPDLVITDIAIPGMDVVEVIARARRAIPDVPVVVISGAMPENEAVKLFRHGASDLLLKDRLARLGPAVAAALTGRQLAHEVRVATDRERRSAAVLAEVVQRSPAAIGVHGADGVPLAANARYRRLCADGLVEALADLPVDGDEPVELELAGRTYLVMQFPVPAGDDGPPGHGALLTDITRQKRIERKLLAAQGELERQARELRASNAELIAADRLKTDLVSTVSHELRTPLTSIVGYVELLEEAELVDTGSPPRRWLEMISRNSVRLLELIDNLLLLARTDGVAGVDAVAGPDGTAGVASGGPVDVAAVVEDVAAVLLPSAIGGDLALEVEIAPDQGPFETVGDRHALERALLNLGSNAIKFSQPGGRVTLRVDRPPGGSGDLGPHLRVRVCDQGIGIGPDELAQLGTRFFRSENARVAQVQGTGLGLAVVFAIVAQHGGRVDVTSQEGHGTTVTVWLPAR